MDEKISPGLTGFLAGAAAGLILSLAWPPPTNEIEVFQRENKPAAMRIYRMGADYICVEDSKREGKYIPLSEYLDCIEDKAEREIEKAEIKKIVGWYEKNK